MKYIIKLKKPNFSFFKTELSLASVYTIARKEFKSFFYTPIGFALIVLFIAAVSILLYGFLNYFKPGRADLEPLFTAIGIAFIFVIPAFTMNAFAKEKNLGTMEFILSKPVSIVEYVLGKFLAVVFLVLLLILITLPFTIAVAASAEQPLDLGQTIVRYFGGFLLGVSFASIGLAVSSLFKNETIALLASLIVCTLFIFTGTGIIPVLDLFSNLSLLRQYQSISRGVIDLRDLAYFCVFTASFVSVAYLFVLKIKHSILGKIFNKSLIITVVVWALTLVIGFLGYLIPGRIDLTSEGLYTLSDSSKKTVSELSDTLNIKLFASTNLPSTLTAYYKTLEDWLKDYSSYSNGKVVFQIKNPDISEADRSDADANNIEPYQLSFSESESSQSSTISYFSLLFKYKDKSDVLNFFTSPDLLSDLEYSITKTIKTISTENKKTVAFLTSGTKFNKDDGLTYFASELSGLYNLENLDLGGKSELSLNDYAAIIIAAPSSEISDTEFSVLQNYFKSGGSIFFMAQGLDLYLNQEVAPDEISSNLLALFSEYGINVSKNLVFDLQNNNKIPEGNVFIQNIIDYPFWILSKKTEAESSILRGIDYLSNLWSSSLNLDEGKNNYKKILVTGNKAGEQSLTELNLTPSALPSDSNSTFTIGVSLELENKARAVILADSDVLNDYVLSQLNSISAYSDSQAVSKNKVVTSIGFGVNSVAWLTKEESLANIKTKNRIPPLFVSGYNYSFIVPLAGSVIPAVAVILAGILNLYLRDKKSKEVYNF